MAGHWIGPIEPRKFLDNFMPISEDDFKKMPTDIRFRLPTRKGAGNKLEKHLYQLFEKTIVEKISPNFDFFIGADGRQKGGNVKANLRPDGGFREKPDNTATEKSAAHGYNLRNVQQNLKIEDPESSDDKKTEPSTKISKNFNWFRDTLVVEFKKSSSMDPFYSEAELKKRAASAVSDSEDTPQSFAKTKAGTARTRGQLAMYAKEVFDHQFCTHAFQLLVFGRHARFIFWDHSGAIVSDSFDYVSNSQTMVEFFWRYNHMTEQDRGKDASVVEASEGEKGIFTEKMEQFLKDMDDPENPQRKLPHAEETLPPAFPVYKVTVVDDMSGKSEDVLIQRPFFRIHAVLGRATRGYIAYVLSSNELKFLKDTWRVDHERLVAERTLCRVLEKAGVPNVPAGVFGGDVKANGPYGRTLCRDWAMLQTLSVVYQIPRIFYHHRLLEELLYPASSAIDSYEFVVALRDCFSAIEGANDLCDLLHRDISIGNVMLSGVEETFRGILVDWDHATKNKLPTGSTYQNFRTGTWQFMSIALLRDSNKAHEILDDFESLFWVLVYGALHYFDYKIGKNQPFSLEMFEERVPVHQADRELYVGGDKKMTALEMITTWVTFTSLPLHKLIDDVAAEFLAYYRLKHESRDTSSHTRTQTAPQSQPAGAHVKKRPTRARPDLSQRLERAAKKKDRAEALREYEELRAKMSKASYWSDIFDEALASGDDWLPDARGEDAAPPQTRKQETAAIARSQLASHVTGEYIASQDPRGSQIIECLRKDHEEAAAKTKKAVAAKAEAEAKAKAKAKAEAGEKAAQDAERLEWQNRMSDDDDDDESCICETEIQSREDPMEAQFPPFSSSNMPTRAPASTSIPNVAAPRRSTRVTRSTPAVATNSASNTLVSGQSVGSSRLKRSIDEIGTATDSNGEPSFPLSKKSRSKSRATAAPTGRKTRTSSQKSTVPPPAAAEAVVVAATKETKVVRPRRELRKTRSGADMTVAQPRREGLRPRTTRSTLQ
ncbi:hypothetical protein BDY19DRAFT_942281 [Irpex rosettiformis]|uniref:Uncharacterized protein n=1 Tax=Irpex rosettiformis TaxID=378272 RepID=A0ACB8U531_9APHY|nr:hypothetical protein BDY19DRAFT_942281 [Irpex rosettiformis]